MHRTDKYSEDCSIIWSVWASGSAFFYELSGSEFRTSCSHLTSRFCACFCKEHLEIQTTIACRFTLKRVLDITRTYSQMHSTDKCSEHISINWSVWANVWVFVYKLSGSGFETSCSHSTFRFCASFGQGASWHSGNYRVWSHSETRTW